MADSAKKRELIAQIDRARSKATACRRELKGDLNVADRVHEVGEQVRYELKESVDQHRGLWLGGAALLGLLISKIPPRTKVIVRGNGSKASREATKAGKAGLFVAALGWLFSLVRPMLISWGRKRLVQAFTERQRRI
ncbi:MAG TPA: hypothetical protein VGO11_22465 [Chthoniobacteraceae bacterium]|jgi:hypothetical protein|nr:hypothetical protein [Chthoniobacteraceae bacterium]